MCFEDQVGYLAQHVSKTTACELMRANWRTVGDIAGRVVDRYGPEDPLAGLVNIGVDELSVRRRHKYITVVTDHDRGCVVWAAEGKTADVLAKFFDKLGAAPRSASSRWTCPLPTPRPSPTRARRRLRCSTGSMSSA